MTLLDIKKKVCRKTSIEHTAGVSEDPEITDSVVTETIESIHKEVCDILSNHRLGQNLFEEASPDTQNLVSGTTSYDKPSDCLKILTVWIKNESDGNYIKASPYDIRSKHNPSNDRSKTLVKYRDLYGAIEIDNPDPDANITDGIKMYYLKRPSALSDDADILSLPDKAGRIIAQGSIAEIKDMQEDPTYIETKAIYRNMLQGWMDDLTPQNKDIVKISRFKSLPNLTNRTSGKNPLQW